MNSFLDHRVVEAVGKYGGIIGITLLITASFFIFTLKIAGDDLKRIKLAKFMIVLYALFGVIAMGAHLIVSRIDKLSTLKNEDNRSIGNTTLGPNSPIVSGNHGQITINSESHKASR